VIIIANALLRAICNVPLSLSLSLSLSLYMLSSSQSHENDSAVQVLPSRGQRYSVMPVDDPAIDIARREAEPGPISN